MTGLRLPESLNELVTDLARRTGVPRNTFLKVLAATAVAADEMKRTPLTPDQFAVVERAVALVRGQATTEEADP